MESVLREIYTCNKQNKTPETKERTVELYNRTAAME